jgi:hypothetical protein
MGMGRMGLGAQTWDIFTQLKTFFTHRNSSFLPSFSHLSTSLSNVRRWHKISWGARLLHQAPHDDVGELGVGCWVVTMEMFIFYSVNFRFWLLPNIQQIHGAREFGGGNIPLPTASMVLFLCHMDGIIRQFFFCGMREKCGSHRSD